MTALNLADSIRLGMLQADAVYIGGVKVWPAPYVYPLDQVSSGLPAYAVGIKKLTASYSGPAIRVVRPSDSAAQDISFVNNVLDAASLATFLGAQFGQVDIMYDQTGNGNHVTQTMAASRPEIWVTMAKIGGSTGVNFKSQYMNLAAGLTNDRQACEIYGVYSLFSSVISTCLIEVGLGSGTSVSLFEQPPTGKAAFFQGAGAIGAAQYPIKSAPIVFQLRLSASSGVVTQDDESFSGAAATAGTYTGGQIGNIDWAGGYIGFFALGCSIGYSTSLTTGNNVALVAALNTTFDIPVTATNRVVFMGDSITAASHPPAARYNGYAKQAIPLLSKASWVYNFGRGGDQLYLDLPGYPNNAHKVLGAYGGNRVCFLLMGTNDLTLGGRTDAQIYADIQTFAGYVRADGGKIIVSTLTPNSSWNSTQIATQQALNNSIRTNWASFADGLCDFASDPVMGPQSAAANTTLYADGLHPTEYGYSLLAPIAAAAINVLLV